MMTERPPKELLAINAEATIRELQQALNESTARRCTLASERDQWKAQHDAKDARLKEAEAEIAALRAAADQKTEG